MLSSRSYSGDWILMAMAPRQGRAFSRFKRKELLVPAFLNVRGESWGERQPGQDTWGRGPFRGGGAPMSLDLLQHLPRGFALCPETTMWPTFPATLRSQGLSPGQACGAGGPRTGLRFQKVCRTKQVKQRKNAGEGPGVMGRERSVFLEPAS